MNCPLCATALQDRADDYYFICPRCGAYVKDRQFYVSEAREWAEYEKHNNDVNDPRYQKFTSPITNAVLKEFGTTHLGLDYGCGSGPVIAKQLTDQGFKVKYYDPFYHPGTDYLRFRYDYIFSCEVFEHFHHPKQEIEKLLGSLRAKGKLFVMTLPYDGTLAFSTWHYRRDPTHVFIYTKQTFDYLGDAFNVKVEQRGKRLFVLEKRV